MRNFLPNVELFRQGGATAGGITNVDMPEILVQGAGGVAWIVSTASQANTGVCVLAAQGRNDSGDSWVDIPGATSSHTSTGSETGHVFGLEVRAPRTRYVRLQIRRTVANTAIESVLGVMLDLPHVPQPISTTEHLSTVLAS